jgi:hypothetical protein
VQITQNHTDRTEHVTALNPSQFTTGITGTAEATSGPPPAQESSWPAGERA